MAQGTVAVRTVHAPTEAEARSMAAPVIEAFSSEGWVVSEIVWIPGDRRPGLGESLLLGPESQLLLEGDGTLRVAFAHADSGAVPPTVEFASRAPDTFEAIGGVRYRRLVPRWGIGLVIGAIGLVVMLAFASGFAGNPFGPAPTPDDGTCPVGWIPGKDIRDGVVVDSGRCDRVP